MPDEILSHNGDELFRVREDGSIAIPPLVTREQLIAALLDTLRIQKQLHDSIDTLNGLLQT